MKKICLKAAVLGTALMITLSIACAGISHNKGYSEQKLFDNPAFEQLAAFYHIYF